MKKRFGFECGCALCSLRGKALARSDGRQEKLHTLTMELGRLGAQGAQAVTTMAMDTMERIAGEREALLRAEGQYGRPRPRC